MMQVSDKPYVVAHINEECQCEECGWPMELGDKVHFAELVDSTDHSVVYADGVFCSLSCAKMGLPRVAARRQHAYAMAHA
jgi:hypothetical protein